MLYDGTRYDNHHYEKCYFVRLYSGFVKAVIIHWWPHVLARRVWTLAKLTSLFALMRMLLLSAWYREWGEQVERETGE